MKTQPTGEQWACLGPMERFHFRLADRINRTNWIKDALSVPNATVGRAWVELFVHKMCLDHGFDNFRLIDPDRAVLLVANHRSLFDQFSMAARLFTMYGNHHRIFFPIRAPFFYDSPAGLALNLALAFGSMYPPIARDPKRKVWNRFAMEVLAELLQDPRNMVGFHPEGRRNRSEDPYDLLPGQPGCGMLIHRARPNVVPVFLQGFPDNPWPWTLKTLGLAASCPPAVHMVMGAPLDLAEELAQPADPRLYVRISRKVMEA
ncbi:MAG: 1-acyl-sn-glycerol-3-phosphate acyltransferase, partial [Candidatus Eremiobacterota bacterium]